MAADYILRTGDFIKITMNPPETYPTLLPPIPLLGSSPDMMVGMMPVCLEGDETPALLLAPQPYISPTFYTTPGMGMVTIKIGPSNKTSKTTNGGKPILITGQTFQVEFDVTVPAIYVNEVTGVPVTDAVTKKTGTAQFINTNVQVKAD